MKNSNQIVTVISISSLIIFGSAYTGENTNGATAIVHLVFKPNGGTVCPDVGMFIA